MIYVTSDLHLCHNKEFLYQPRGFTNVYEMNDAILKNWNSVVQPEDDVYVLGDLMLNDDDTALRIIHQLKGTIHVIRGNHDSDNRISKYLYCSNIVEVVDAKFLRYKNYHFFLSHFPCLTGNIEKESIHQMTLNLFGHTHSKNIFYNDIFYMYNVACDAHNCTPVSIDRIIEEMSREQFKNHK